MFPPNIDKTTILGQVLDNERNPKVSRIEAQFLGDGMAVNIQMTKQEMQEVIAKAFVEKFQQWLKISKEEESFSESVDISSVKFYTWRLG